MSDGVHLPPTTRDMQLLNWFLDWLRGRHAEAGRYVSEKSFQKNLSRQLAMAPRTLAQMSDHGVTDFMQLKLEYFFYTDAESKAQALTYCLKERGYDVEMGRSAHDTGLMLVTGWTNPIEMTDDAVLAWTESMCRLGYEHDCEFDGWGTNVPD